MNTIITIFSSIVVPLIVAWIGSGKIVKHLRVNDLNEKIDKLDYKIDENQALTYRTRILRFNGEIKRGIKHDEEEFNDCLEAIDGYEHFCNTHPDFPNNKSILAIENVKECYKKAYSKNNF